MIVIKLLLISLVVVYSYHTNKYHKNYKYNSKFQIHDHSLIDIVSVLDIASLQSIVPIPVEISSTDSIVSNTNTITNSIINNPVPNNSIDTLEGGDNLGTLLWSYILYNGLFTNGKPADWYLPVASKVFNNDNDEWYKDYIDGYSFEVPVLIEAVRFATFFALGYYVNLAIITLFDSDSFWYYHYHLDHYYHHYHHLISFSYLSFGSLSSSLLLLSSLP